MSQFLIRQRAVLKVYLINLVEKQQDYGLAYLDDLRSELRGLGYIPSHTEIYRALHDLVEVGILKRVERKLHEEGYQKVVTYVFTESGYYEGQRYKEQVKNDLDRSAKVIQKILADNYR